jgi:hypothetical protein
LFPNLPSLYSLKTNGWLNQSFITRTIFIRNQWKMFYVEETWSPQQPMALRMEALWTTLVWIPRSRARMKRSEWVVAPKGSPTTCQFKSLSYSTKYHCSRQCFEHFGKICQIKYNAIELFSERSVTPIFKFLWQWWVRN